MQPSPAAPADAGIKLQHLFFYAVAQIGSSLFFHVLLIILLPFLTNYLAVPAAIAGLVIFVPKIWVVFCDPLMGSLSDRVRDPARRRRPFVLWGGIATAVLFAVIFHAPLIANPYLMALVVGLLYLAGSTAYSAFSVPYLALAAEIAPRPNLVTVVTSWRMTFNFIGALLAGLAPLLVQKLGEGKAGYGNMGYLLGAVCLVTVTMFYLGTRSLPIVDRARPDPSFSQWLTLFGNRNFVILLRTYVIQLLGIGVIQSSFFYYVVYQVGGTMSTLSQTVLFLMAGSLVAQPLWVGLSKRLGKLTTYRVATVCMILAEGAYLLPGKGDNALLMLISFCVGLAAAGYALMAWSMLYDIIETDSARSGSQRAGAFTGVWSACEKVAIAVGVLTTGVLLQAFGFHGGTTGFGAQPDSALLAARFVPGLVPSSLLILSLVSLLPFRPAAPKEKAAALG